jgi:Effector-associated domain 1
VLFVYQSESARKEGVDWLATGLGLGTARKVQRLEKVRFDELWTALLPVFDRNSMEQMLRVKMGVNLEDEVPQGGFRDQVFCLIQWAEGAGRVDELARKALEAKPHSPALRAYVAGLRDREPNVEG